MTHGSVGDLARRARLGEVEGLGRQVRRTAGCSNPVRLRGRQDRITAGDGRDPRDDHHGARAWGRSPRRLRRSPSGHLPIVRTRIPGRRVPPGSSRSPRREGHLEAVAGHPAVIVTLTAPSFGRVHTIRDRDGLCACIAATRRRIPSSGRQSIPIRTDTRTRSSGTTSRPDSGNARRKPSAEALHASSGFLVGS